LEAIALGESAMVSKNSLMFKVFYPTVISRIGETTEGPKFLNRKIGKSEFFPHGVFPIALTMTTLKYFLKPQVSAQSS
jgi:hypothetical protein